MHGDFLLHPLWRFTAQHFHAHVSFDGTEIQFDFPAFLVKAGQRLFREAFGIQQGGHIDDTIHRGLPGRDNRRQPGLGLRRYPHRFPWRFVPVDLVIPGSKLSALTKIGFFVGMQQGQYRNALGL